MNIYIYILTDWNLEPRFGNFPYPEKVPGTTRSDFGKIDLKKMIFLRFAKLFTVIRTQNHYQKWCAESQTWLPLGLSQFLTRKVPVKLAE